MAKLLSLPKALEKRAELCCAAAARHEESGHYREAVVVLQPLWAGPGQRPETQGLSPRASALLLLRCGAVTGWLGSERQSEGRQEAAKDLLSEAVRIAVAVDEILWAEAVNALAVCYWRLGAFSEAKAVLGEVLEHAERDSRWALVASINFGIVEWCEGRHEEALARYRGLASAVEREGSDSLLSLYHHELGCALMQSGITDQAIIELTAATVYFERTGHARFRAAAENNLGHLFMLGSDFTAAHLHFERAETIFARLGDEVHFAQAKDSRAMAYLAEYEFEAAADVAEQAVAILERGDQHALLVDSLVNYGDALVGCGKPRAALRSYVRAYELASDHIGSERAAQISVKLISVVAGETSLSGHLTFDEAVKHFESSFIALALKEEGGNQSRAAMRMGMSQQALSYILGTRHETLRPVQKRGRRRKDSVKQTADVLQLSK